MSDNDTVKLLRECNSGVQMAVYSIEDILDDVQNEQFKQILKDTLNVHNRLGNRTHELLSSFGEETKEPNPIAKGMSWMKTNVKLVFNESDSTIADLMTEGCNMGVKSLNKYLNEYEAANEITKDITKRLIHLEEKLVTDIKCYL